MILGVTILRKKYPLAKYLCVLLIVSGVALFLYKPNKSSAVADEHVFGFGEILLVRPHGFTVHAFHSYHIYCHAIQIYPRPLTVSTTTVTNPWHLSHGVFPCVIADLIDIGRFDWCSPGPHEVSLPGECQPHDAEHQHVVHSGAGTRWVSRSVSPSNSSVTEYMRVRIRSMWCFIPTKPG